MDPGTIIGYLQTKFVSLSLVVIWEILGNCKENDCLKNKITQVVVAKIWIVLKFE